MSANSSPIFSVGQKIVCINDAFPGAIADWCDSLPVAGHVYTIRAMQVGQNHVTGFSNLGFLLAEIANPLSSRGGEGGFLWERFAPWLETCSETKHNEAVELAHLIEKNLAYVRKLISMSFNELVSEDFAGDPDRIRGLHVEKFILEKDGTLKSEADDCYLDDFTEIDVIKLNPTF